jgi:hypothetical protein
MKKSFTTVYLYLVARLASASPCGPAAANPPSPETEFHPRTAFQNFPALNITVRSPFLQLQVKLMKNFALFFAV